MADRPHKRSSPDAPMLTFRPKGTVLDPPLERRTGARFPCSASAEVSETESRARIMGRTTDLGIGGCYVDTINPFPVGTTVRLKLADKGRSFESHAEVIFAQIGMGMGLAFTEIRADQLDVLRQWVGELSGALAPMDSPDMPTLQEYAARASASAVEQPAPSEHLVLNQLISLLIRKHVITEAEGTALLRELYG